MAFAWPRLASLLLGSFPRPHPQKGPSHVTLYEINVRVGMFVDLTLRPNQREKKHLGEGKQSSPALSNHSPPLCPQIVNITTSIARWSEATFTFPNGRHFTLKQNGRIYQKGLIFPPRYWQFNCKQNLKDERYVTSYHLQKLREESDNYCFMLLTFLPCLHSFMALTRCRSLFQVSGEPE